MMLLAVQAHGVSHSVRGIITTGGSCLDRMQEEFVGVLHACKGRVLVTGVGKSGCVARRMSVSLSSTGTPVRLRLAAGWYPPEH